MEDETADTGEVEVFDPFDEEDDSDGGAAAAADDEGGQVIQIPTAANGEAPNPVPLPEVFEDRALLLDVRGMTFDRWATFGPTMIRMQDASPFWLGDWANAGERQWGDDIYQVIDVERFGEVAVKTITNAQWVCGKVPPKDRHAGLSWTHHRIAAELPSITLIRKALKTAVREQMTTRELQAWVDEHKPDKEGASERKKKSIHTWNLSFTLPVEDEATGDRVHEALQEALEKAFVDFGVSTDSTGVKITPSKS